jgi:hypothetical protein
MSKMSYPSSPVRRIRLWVVLGLIAIIVVYNMPLSHNAIPVRSWPASYHGHRLSKGDSRIANGTLGFAAIFALGLPDRTDKRDAMELSAALTGLKLTWSDGVQGDTMNPKAVPPVHTDPDPAARMKLDAEVGCWRGHMNILQKIVKEGLGSALILEDDADWDVRIEQQMQQFAVATQDVLAQKPRSANPTRPHHDSPYGDDWDLFWIGHLGAGRQQPISPFISSTVTTASPRPLTTSGSRVTSPRIPSPASAPALSLTSASSRRVAAPCVQSATQCRSRVRVR